MSVVTIYFGNRTNINEREISNNNRSATHEEDWIYLSTRFNARLSISIQSLYCHEKEIEGASRTYLDGVEVEIRDNWRLITSIQEDACVMAPFDADRQEIMNQIRDL